ncbi:DUF1116 domain-containing protein [Salinicola peritrichatus]|uniref:oxamate carbamoyltransferase subunit AllG family protein n=1 Tax=Salinicola peritrichatus TaxID=1267424 RepID=UPI000DA134E8|nr:DUF1116 domain-containing protein [Salinicola peritrichatus]
MPNEHRVATDTRRAAEAMAYADPVWRGVVRAGELTKERCLLHAGPPLPGVEAHCPPVLNAACAALIFEGMAADESEARRLLASGEVTLSPAQDHGIVTPLAAVVSPSMYLHRVVDRHDADSVAYAPLSEGVGPAQRFGQLTPAVVARLAWMHRHFGPALAAAGALDVDVLALAEAGLAAGDELHGRVGVGSSALAKALASAGLDADSRAFLDGNPQSFLNLWMAACKMMMVAAARVGQGNLLVAAGGNGVDFGVQFSHAPGVWHHHPTSAPEGVALSPALADIAVLPAIGDSAVIDAVGFGALALDAAPEQAALLGDRFVNSMLSSRPALAVTHPRLGRAVGLDALAIDAECPPGVCLAMLDAAGEVGIVGRGGARHPGALYKIDE